MKQKLTESQIFAQQQKLVEKTTILLEQTAKNIFESTDKNDKKSLVKNLLNGWKNIKQTFKNPNDVKHWFNSKNGEIQKYVETSRFPSKIKTMLLNIIDKLRFAIQKDDEQLNEGLGSFLKKHWLKILILIYVLALFVPGAMFGMIVAYDSPTSVGILPGIAGAVYGGLATVWYGTLSILSHIPFIGKIFQLLI